MSYQLLPYIEDLFKVHSAGHQDGSLILLGQLQEKATYEDLQERLKVFGIIPRLFPYGGLTALKFLPMQGKTKLNYKLSALLLAVTFITTLFAGALQHGTLNPFQPGVLGDALSFSLFLMAILGLHETGHFLLARRHGVQATLPFFIPAPTLIGTFGAVIRIQSPIPHRRALMEIGAAGPIFGFLVAVCAAAIGLPLSRTAPPVQINRSPHLLLGENLLFLLLEKFFAAGGSQGTLSLHPIAFAAWIGFFVTALNLFPIGQFDGGHILYALFPHFHRVVSRIVQVFLVGLGFFWPGWWVWAFISFVFPMRHQGCLDELKPIGLREKMIAVATLLMFVLCFTPVPFAASRP